MSWLQAAFHSRLVHLFVATGHEKMGMKVGFKNFGETVSPSDFMNVVWTHAYSFSGMMVFYFELKMMSMNFSFEKIVSRACFVGTQAWLPYLFPR